jgi:hypothetical protein
VRAQLVGDQQFRHQALLFEQLAHQPQRGVLVAAGLNKHIEDLAFVIYGAPQIHPPAIGTTISSRCHRLLGHGRRCRSLHAIIGPNFNTQRRTVS